MSTLLFKSTFLVQFPKTLYKGIRYYPIIYGCNMALLLVKGIVTGSKSVGRFKERFRRSHDLCPAINSNSQIKNWVNFSKISYYILLLRIQYVTTGKSKRAENG
jgi:hypothetical protein